MTAHQSLKPNIVNSLYWVKITLTPLASHDSAVLSDWVVVVDHMSNMTYS